MTKKKEEKAIGLLRAAYKNLHCEGLSRSTQREMIIEARRCIGYAMEELAKEAKHDPE
jgi:hypothetical protein